MSQPRPGRRDENRAGVHHARGDSRTHRYLRSMPQQNDLFDRDEDPMRFFGYAPKYVRARETLIDQIGHATNGSVIDVLDEMAARWANRTTGRSTCFVRRRTPSIRDDGGRTGLDRQPSPCSPDSTISCAPSTRLPQNQIHRGRASSTRRCCCHAVPAWVRPFSCDRRIAVFVVMNAGAQPPAVASCRTIN